MLKIKNPSKMSSSSSVREPVGDWYDPKSGHVSPTKLYGHDPELYEIVRKAAEDAAARAPCGERVSDYEHSLFLKSTLEKTSKIKEQSSASGNKSEADANNEYDVSAACTVS